RAILTALGVHAVTREQMTQEIAAVHESTWRQPCEPVFVQQVGMEGTWSFRMPGDENEHTTIHIEWSIRDETGRHLLTEKAGPGLQPTDHILLHGQHYWKFELPIPMGLALGYYDLTTVGTSSSRQVHGSLRLIIVPMHCYQPAQIETGGRLWGVSLQLYALRSTHNWGVGDFTDLFQWTEWAAMELGAGMIGLNPLHALKNSRPYHISPYSPDSRFYLNVLYVDVEQIPEFQESTEAQGIAEEEGFLSCLEALNKSDTVDYERVAAVKRQVLNALFATFEKHHFRREVDHLVPCTARAEDFAQYLQREGHALEAFALFQVLYEKFSQASPPQLVWQDWPEAYRQPTSTGSQEFRAAHRREIRFHQYVQWLAHQQLRRVHERTRELGMPIGLYHDLALGSDRGGSDAWIFQSVLALGADCGCPPDAFAPEGQNWGLPPVNPHALRRGGYQMFIDLLRKNLQYGGAIRLDHVMTLFRLFWIPRGLPPSAGAYVQYPWEDLLGILALESVRHRAVIVGEDLGTVPDIVRDKLAAAGVLSYRVFYFERGDNGEWKRPAMYPRQALAVVTTHDLPTLAGFWTGEDLRVRERLGFYPDESAHRRALDERQREKAGIAHALRNEGVWPAGVDEANALRQPLSPDLMDAIHLYVARSPSSFMLITLEDFIGDATQVNLPGTLDSYPNWSHKALLTLAEAKESANARQLVRAVKTARP
ncbi:MAG: 4-alpha-glucanotransferase, partial [Nitrospirota bacterium]|nr:4-alpha-glucanotransferase [Nitrospirota bacterium]